MRELFERLLEFRNDLGLLFGRRGASSEDFRGRSLTFSLIYPANNLMSTHSRLDIARTSP